MKKWMMGYYIKMSVMEKNCYIRFTIVLNHVSVFIGAADFEAKYVERERLGKGGFGTVYAGIRRSDDLLVST